MKVRPANATTIAKLNSLGLSKTYDKKVALFEQDNRHNSLHYELLQQSRRAYPQIRSFRLNRKYRILGYELGNEFQPINVTNHYGD